jgi:hypothetical protein
MTAKYNPAELETNWSLKAMLLSSGFHGILLALNFTYDAPEMKVRTDAIEVKMVTMEEVQKNKVLKEVSPFKESEVMKAPVKKVIAGTEKVIPKSKALGNPEAKKVQKVQKGDPLSSDYSAYKKDTDFRKLKSTNLGTGAGTKFEGAKMGGGSGDTYKGLDFATKSLTGGKLGHRFKIRSAADDMGAGAGKGGGIGDGIGKGFGDGTITGTPNGTIEKAKILTNVGSLTGATTGIIGTSKGSEGLSAKGTVMLAGTPDETVVLGSIDPSVIRQILMEHIAQFRYCYQSELEKTDSPLSGVLQLNFSIASNGSVSKAAVGGNNSITGQVKNCVTGVLRGIQFPSPKGGGSVEVKQPMNFYPKQF